MQLLASLLFKDYRQKVLGLLLLHPNDEYHVREIARITKTVAGTLHRELKQLADVGILSKQKRGNQVLYKANLSNPIYEELVGIFRKLGLNTNRSKNKEIKMDNLVDSNREAILLLAQKNGVRNVRVFGSMARNTASDRSDLDLLVDLEEGASGFAMGGFLADVSDLVQRKVDVVTENSLYPAIKNKVLQEAVPV